MKRNNRLLAPLLILLLLSACLSDEKEIIITGNIQKQENFDLTESELQLIPVSAGNELQVDHAVFKFDQGTLVSINYPSEYPSLKLNSKTKFSYRIEKLPEGKYVLAVHMLKPKYHVDYGPSDVKYVGRVLKGDTGQYVVIEANKEILPPLKISLADVTIPLEEKNTILRRDFPDPIILKY
jgi:hypothetical protein